MIPSETIPGMGEGDKGEWWMVEGVDSSMIYCKNFCKCHNVSPLSTTIKNKHKADRET
jgi:hypothetical protein